jgi:hypothetical protein
MTEPTSIYTVANATSAVGIVGGLLGFYTFIDNYILKFKPKFVLGDRLYLTYKQHPKYPAHSHLSSLVLQFEIFNHRNKLGRVEDLCFRIYDSLELEAKVTTLFASAYLEDMPVERTDVLTAKRSPMGPAAIDHKSSRTLVVEMSPEKNMGQFINPNGQIKIETLYKSSRGKWIQFDSLSVYAVYDEKTTVGEFTTYNFDLLDKYSERENLKKQTFKRKINSYTGISNYQITHGRNVLIWKLSNLGRFFKRTASLISGIVNATLSNAISETFYWALVKRKAGWIEKRKITVGHARNGNKTDELIKKLGSILARKIKAIEQRAAQSGEITLELKGSEIMLLKAGITLKIYKGGDGYVYAMRISQNSSVGQGVFSFEIKNYPFAIDLWTSNGNAIFPAAIATKLIDYVALFQGSGRFN